MVLRAKGLRGFSASQKQNKPNEKHQEEKAEAKGGVILLQEVFKG